MCGSLCNFSTALFNKALIYWMVIAQIKSFETGVLVSNEKAAIMATCHILLPRDHVLCVCDVIGSGFPFDF